MALSRCPLLGEAGSEEEDDEEGRSGRALWTRDHGYITTDNVFKEGMPLQTMEGVRALILLLQKSPQTVRPPSHISWLR